MWVMQVLQAKKADFSMSEADMLLWKLLDVAQGKKGKLRGGRESWREASGVVKPIV
jgi:hypothetical protein